MNKKITGFFSRMITTLGILIVPLTSLSSDAVAQEISAARKEIEAKLSEDNIHPTRFIVRYKEGISENEIKQKSLAYTSREQGFLKPKNGPVVQSIGVGDSSTFDSQVLADKNTLNNLKEANKNKLKTIMMRYRLDPDVESVDVAHLGEVLWTDSGTKTYSDDFDQTPTPDTGNHWYYDKVNLPELWDDQECATAGPDCGGDSSVTVAVLDTGLAYEDYTGNYEYGGYSFSNVDFDPASEITGINLYTNSSDPYNNGDEDSNGICDDYHGVDMEQWYENTATGDPGTCSATSDIQKEGHANDDYGHGTFVTGIIASLTNNAASSVSVAHNVTIMPVKTNVPTTGSVWEDTFYYSVIYAVDYGADVINASLGWCNSETYLQQAVDYAEAAGVTMVIASGNSTCGWSTPLTYPANYTDSNVIAVGAVNANDSRSSYSQYGLNLDLVAPVGQGSGVGTAVWQQSYTCFNTNDCGDNVTTDYTSFSDQFGIGTSYATPQVAAGTALIKSRFPSLSPTEIWNILIRTAIDITSYGSGQDQQTGYGIVNFEDLWNQPYLTQPSQWRNDFGNNGDQWFVGDFNGDSNADIALVRDNGTYTQTWWVALSNGSSFNTVTQWRGDFGNRGDQWYVGNFNGDSYDDIALVRDNGEQIQTLWVALSNGSSFNTVSQWRDDFGKRGDQWFIGNFNGDSYDDIALVRDNGTYTQTWWVALSNGSSFNTVSTWRDDFGNRGDQWYIGNFDGDSYDDIALVRDNGTYTQTWWVALSNGSSFNIVSTWAGDFGNRGDHWYVGNFNGDSYDDIALVRDNGTSLQSWWIAISDGNDFNDVSNWRYDFGNRGNQWFIGDFDNDGLSDVSVVINASTYVQTWWVIFGTL